MADRIRFHFDEHVDPAIASALRRAGIDVTTAIGAGLRTKNDDAHLKFARAERRVIVTRDQDFLRFRYRWIIAESFSTQQSNQLEKSLRDSF